MKIQTNKYTLTILVAIFTLIIVTFSFLLLGKIWEKKSSTNNSSSTSTSSVTLVSSSSSTTSLPQFSYDIENDKYYSEVFRLSEEVKKLATTGENDFIDPNNKNLIYTLNEETHFVDFVELSKQRTEKVYKTELFRINIPTFCSTFEGTTENYFRDVDERQQTEFKNAINGLYAPNVKKITIDGLYSYEIYDIKDHLRANADILVKGGMARFINLRRWTMFGDSDIYGMNGRYLGLFLNCRID